MQEKHQFILDSPTTQPNYQKQNLIQDRKFLIEIKNKKQIQTMYQPSKFTQVCSPVTTNCTVDKLKSTDCSPHGLLA